MRISQNDNAALSYLGGTCTKPCLDAVVTLLQGGLAIRRADILTATDRHALLLALEADDKVAVKSGFASGYAGEAPRTFSYVLQLLREHGVKIDEYRVEPALLDRLDRSALRESDLSMIDGATPVRPMRWFDYILDAHREAGRTKTLWSEFPPVVPFAIVDPQLMDLALGFWEDPDARLTDAYRRLEDLIRARIGSEEHGAKLFEKAFRNGPTRLAWPGLIQAETAARTDLFKSVFGAFRNPRFHRELSHRPDALLSELLLINQLFRLEREAVEVPEVE
jgi:hypothetical protein